MDKFYNQFPEIKIPAFLQNWEDDSWGNNVTASSRKDLPLGAAIIVWVNSDKVENREMWEGSKYIVVLEDESGDPLADEWEANTEEEALKAISHFEVVNVKR